MSFRRFLEVFRLEFAFLLRRPMVWILIGLLGLLSFGMSTGRVQVSSGDASVGGTKAWITSEFTTAFVLTMMVSALYLFFLAVAAGMRLLDDDQAKVGEVLHATPLRAGEYIWGKALAAIATFTVVLGVHLVLMALFNHLRPSPVAAEIRGPFEVLNYLRPALIFALPALIFFGGVAFYLGERFRRAAWVFLFPIGLMLVMGFFLWNWKPTWLDPAINRALMLVDPSGFRWLDQTWIALDRGADFYNTATIGVDAGFAISRLVFAALGLLAIAAAHRHFARTVGGGARVKLPQQQVDELLSQPLSPPEAPASSTPAMPAPLAMRSKPQSFFATLRQTLRTETGALLREPGVYLFGFLVVTQTLGSSLLALGAFQTSVLLTPGLLAVNSANTLVFLLCPLLMFFIAASLERERTTGFDSLAFSAPVSTAPMLLGKILSNAVLAMVISAAVFLGCAIALLIQGQVGLDVWPFALVWGLLLGPTFLVWSAFVAFLYSLTGNRYATYGLSLGVLVFTLYRQFTDQMNWVGNWMLWDALRWSDLSVFELDRQALWLNRGLALAAALFFFVLALRLFPRRRFDSNRILHRLRPQALSAAGLRLAPWALPALVLGSVLFLSVTHGPEGSASQKKAEDYWKQNLATWKDAPLPALRQVTLDLRLEPADSGFETRGSYLFENPYDHELRRFALTGGAHWQEPVWSLDGEEYEPDDRTGLYVFTPEQPLAPGEQVLVGFHFSGRYPDGPTKNGGQAQEFILPSGVVLTSFRPTVLPIPGFIESVGVDDDNRYEPKEYPDDYFEEVLRPFTGSQYSFTTRITVSGPEDYRYNSVGVLESETVENGRRTAVWVSDHPVRLFNVVAGRWTERQGEGTTLYYDPRHAYNVDEMGKILDASRHYFSQWFYPYPWQELRISEFPGLAGYAQGFPTNITFSEAIGFLTENDDETNTVALVTAHEVAHQWWGNLLTPADGPGGNILSEGMAHFSTALLLGEVEGERARRGFMKRIEERYGDRRRKDAERPLVKIDGSKRGDTTVTYDRGGWVAWMLMQELGREAMLEGLQSFIAAYKDGPDFPLVEDLVQHLRPYAEDPAAYDAFVNQWIFDTVVPRFQLHDATKEATGNRWRTAAELENAGTGRVAVTIAAIAGERFTEDGDLDPDYREVRTTVWLDAGDKLPVELLADFEPDELVVDPDIQVLQLQRNAAVAKL